MDVRRSLIWTTLLSATGFVLAADAQQAVAQRLPEKNSVRPQVRVAQRDAQAPTDQAQATPSHSYQNLPTQVPAPRNTAPNPPGALRLAPRAPQAPFKLDEKEQKALDAVLVEWERRSDKIARFKCDFQRWDYDPAAGPTAIPQGRADLKGLKARGSGEIKYKAPDHGVFKLDKYEQYIPQKDATTLKYEENPTAREHWVCDGQAIYQFRPKEQQLIETRLPPELQGKAISDGPLPFIFGAKAETLKKRYWLRITTPDEQAKTDVWLEAYPKFQQDAANFAKVDLILGRENFLPVAMQIHTPGRLGVRTVYRFGEPSVNGLLSKFNGEFASPMTPLGWKRIVEHVPSAEAPAAKNVQLKQQPADATARRGEPKTK